MSVPEEVEKAVSLHTAMAGEKAVKLSTKVDIYHPDRLGMLRACVLRRHNSYTTRFQAILFDSARL